MTAVRLSKRWRLREAVTVDAVLTLVQEQVAPHYGRLSPEVVLGLEQVAPTTVIATQRWSSRAALEAATTSATYDAWWDDYLPILATWDSLVTFEAEWESVELL